MRNNTIPKFQIQNISRDIKQKMILSLNECKDLTERSLKCPYCGFTIEGIFSDAKGHLRVKCPKCKAGMVLNLAYFRKKKTNYIVD